GDVAMLAARLVGPSGEVVGVERDSHSIKRARARVTEAGFHNVSFTECDVSEVHSSKPFDAAVGRFILQWVPDPVAVLRFLSQLVRPGRVLAFQEGGEHGDRSRASPAVPGSRTACATHADGNTAWS